MAKHSWGVWLSFSLIVMIAMQALADEFDGVGMPGSFSFSAVCGQYPGVLVESGSVTVTEITDPVTVSVVNGEYSINGGPYTAEPGTVSYGQTLSVRHTAATGEETMKSTVLVVGGRSAAFTSNTGPCLRGTR
jgi:hypothetical protein